MKRPRLLISLAVIASMPFSGFGRQKDDIQINRMLKELCKSRITAFAQYDTGSLDAICTVDYRLITQSGTKMDLEKLRKSIAVKTMKISSFTLLSFQSFVANDQSMAFSIAEVTEEIVGGASIPVINNLLVTDVYVKDDGRWKIQLTHISQKMCVFPE